MYIHNNLSSSDHSPHSNRPNNQPSHFTSTMSGLKNIVVVGGSGNLGAPTVQHLLASNRFTITAKSRRIHRYLPPRRQHCQRRLPVPRLLEVRPRRPGCPCPHLRLLVYGPAIHLSRGSGRRRREMGFPNRVWLRHRSRWPQRRGATFPAQRDSEAKGRGARSDMDRSGHQCLVRLCEYCTSCSKHRRDMCSRLTRGR